MAIPQVTLPVPFEQIPAEVDRLRKHAAALQAEARTTLTLIDAVREGCPHTEHRYWTDYSGETNSECKHCGKRG